MARLEVWKEGKLVEEIALSEAGEYMAGRLDGSAIQTDHISCSRRHALFTVRPDGTVSVMDLGSAQGTAVDGVELRPPRRVSCRETFSTLFLTFFLGRSRKGVMECIPNTYTSTFHIYTPRFCFIMTFIMRSPILPSFISALRSK